MSKIKLFPFAMIVVLFLSGCTTKHHIGVWIDEEGTAPDSDHDGVFDDKDRCLSTPAGLVVDGFGCSSDEDQDGVLNEFDQCPKTPLGTLVNAVGCGVDDDGDGVLNDIDQCPATPLDTLVDAVGCNLDHDGDGVMDHMDKCPNTPPYTPVDAVGCSFDGDGDGVLDHQDKCPNTPQGMKVDCDGCSDVVIKLPSLNGLHFARNSANLKAEALPVLDKVVAVMKQHSDIEVQVIGHTDSRASISYNLDLSKRRAGSVVTYLLSRGIQEARLTAVGRGEHEPVASNSTSEGRAQNRRVEFVIVK